ncbi:MAG: hypothetical protein Q8O67_22380 [Deltaproteobacteria bacterium]|nr:hypothetical protein [Deltaproteobacteria bacterium]
MRSLPSLFACVVVVLACDDGATRAPVTIVVDTDGARAREDTQRLREVQKGVQGDRAQLEKARDDLAAARKSLETAASPAQKATLNAEVRALEARLDQQARGAVVVGDVVTREELDAQLRAQEERLKSFISAELGNKPSSSSSSSKATVPVPAGVSPARGLIAQGKRHLQGLELEVADVDGLLGVLTTAEQAIGRGDDAVADVAARSFSEKANAVVVDRALVRAKYTRVSAVLKGRTLTPDQQARALQLLKSATALSTSDATAANRALNDVLALGR